MDWQQEEGWMIPWCCLSFPSIAHSLGSVKIFRSAKLLNWAKQETKNRNLSLTKGFQTENDGLALFWKKNAKSMYFFPRAHPLFEIVASSLNHFWISIEFLYY